MPDPAPIKTDLVAGNTYAWCRCGQSKKAPFCDGSHRGSGITPLAFTPDASESAWLCACGQSGKGPRCDGSHRQQS
ncbi:MAG: hypothetical protein RL095_2685 [Verrucomicrobiota bacterium]|jgi:CDGSH-type Zn-finger protein